MKVLNYLSRTGLMLLIAVALVIDIAGLCIYILHHAEPESEPIPLHIEVVKESGLDTFTMNVDYRGAGAIVEMLMLNGHYGYIDVEQVSSNRFRFIEREEVN